MFVGDLLLQHLRCKQKALPASITWRQVIQPVFVMFVAFVCCLQDAFLIGASAKQEPT